jgi:hypothetical protein
MSDEKNGWNEWAKYVLKELERQSKKDEEQDIKINNQDKQIARLEVKAGVWGVIGSLVGILILFAVEYLKKA